MSKVTRILVGIPTISPDRRFLASLPVLADGIARNLPHLEVDYVNGWVWNHELVDAQNIFAERVLEGAYDYLLSIEDDHWGFTWQMLDTCMKASCHVAGIPYRSRHFPFDIVPQRLCEIKPSGKHMFSGMNDEKLTGYQRADLLGFGFTLIRSDVFRILDRPFFKLNTENYPGAGPRATDIDFCMRLIKKGIYPIGCFQHRLNHRDISEARYKEMLVHGIMNQQSMFSTCEDLRRAQKMNEKFEANRLANQKLKESSCNLTQEQR